MLDECLTSLDNGSKKVLSSEIEEDKLLIKSLIIGLSILVYKEDDKLSVIFKGSKKVRVLKIFVDKDFKFWINCDIISMVDIPFC